MIIDLHSHILHGIDDGARDIEMSLEMARMAVDDGTTHIACTSHITPGIYDNDAEIIRHKMDELEAALDEANIPLKLIIGADVHISPKMIEGLKSGHIPALNDTRYFLFEPSHHVLPPKLVEFCKKILDADYIPVLTHPERLSWIENHYNKIVEMDELGVPIQITAASITGRFGERAQYWSERMLDEGRVDIIASDAHNIKSRPPGLRKALSIIASRLGKETAKQIGFHNPKAIFEDKPLAQKTRTVTNESSKEKSKGIFGWFK